jgi:hypothetical protein
MQKIAFTLVELIVGITISMLLMVSVWIFVSTGMSNITLQTKILDDNKKTSSDILYLQKNILNSKKYISNIWTNTWILLRQNKYFDKWWFSYIWVKEFDNYFYCWTGEIDKTNHLYVSNFIPLNNVTTDTWNNSWDYKSDIKNHQILKKNWANWDIVVWKDIFWDRFKQWDFGTGVFLNSPTWIVEIGSKVVFSDTLNDRILYLSGSQVYTLLDETDWLNEPIWLAYNSAEKALYIANAGKWEILKLSSKKYFANPELKINWVNKSNIDKIEIEILETSEVLTDSTNISDYNFNSSNDFVSLNWSIISYYFIDNFAGETSQSDCDWSNNWKIVSGNNIIDCISTWTWKLANFRNASFNNFTIKNIKPLLTENKNYYVKIDNKYYPYFTQWDDDIFTKNDNVLEVKESWLTYPNIVNDDWSYVEFDTWSFDFNSLEPDFIFSNPIKKLEKNYSSNLLNIKLNYYKYLNCFNSDEKIERNFLVKKSY